VKLFKHFLAVLGIVCLVSVVLTIIGTIWLRSTGSPTPDPISGRIANNGFLAWNKTHFYVTVDQDKLFRLVGLPTVLLVAALLIVVFSIVYLPELLVVFILVVLIVWLWKRKKRRVKMQIGYKDPHL
jgi:hypothetical protein